MGILSALKNVATSIVSGTKALGTGGITAIPSNIVTRVQEKVAVLTGAKAPTAAESTILKATGVAAASLAAAPVVAAVGIGAIAKGAISAVKAITPSSVIGKVAFAAATPVVATAIISNPLGAARTAKKAVSAEVSLGKLLAEPSKEGAVEFLGEHPIATTILGGVGLAVGAKALGGAATAVASAINTAAIRENTAAKEQPVTSTGEVPTEQGKVLPEKMIDSSGELPPVAETTTITTGKRKRKATKKEIPSVRQSVRVLVQNRASASGMRIKNERYLNERVFN